MRERDELADVRALIWISGRKLQRETIQFVLDAGYGDGFRMLHPDDKGYTFPTWDPHVRLDYVFVPRAFADRLPKCEVITNRRSGFVRRRIIVRWLRSFGGMIA